MQARKENKIVLKLQIKKKSKNTTLDERRGEEYSKNHVKWVVVHHRQKNALIQFKQQLEQSKYFIIANKTIKKRNNKSITAPLLCDLFVLD